MGNNRIGIEGTGEVLVETEPVDLEDIERVGFCCDGCQYARDCGMTEYSCTNGCLYEDYEASNG